MIMSTLSRKVFNQTQLTENIETIKWVEFNLQKMKINGLVTMIQKSKKPSDIKYTSGYISKYKWATRPNSIDISKHLYVIDFVQILSEDFPWGYWDKLITINENEKHLFQESLNIGLHYGPNNLSYSWVIFQNKKKTIQDTNKILLKKIQDCAIPINTINEKYESNILTKWQDIKNKI